jgi:hypothetical protein
MLMNVLLLVRWGLLASCSSTLLLLLLGLAVWLSQQVCAMVPAMMAPVRLRAASPALLGEHAMTRTWLWMLGEHWLSVHG